MPPTQIVLIDIDEATIMAERERISGLRAALVIYHPFWASLLLPMTIRPNLTLPTFAATDCVDHIWFNPAWTRALTWRQLGYILLHEVGHIAFLHALRKGPRDHHKWNVSTDLFINSMLDQLTGDNGKTLYDRPTGVNVPGLGECSLLSEDWAKDLASEQIYERLPDDPKAAAGCPGHGKGHRAHGPQPSDQPGDPGQPGTTGGGNSTPTPQWSDGHCQPGRSCLQMPRPLTADEAESLSDRVQVAYEAWRSSSQRGTMPAGLLRFIEQLRAAKVPWHRVLHQYAGSALAKEDFSLFPPHHRWLDEANIIRPTCRSERMGNLVVAIDTSGSIGGTVLTDFAAEVAKLATLSEDTMVLTCDAQIHQVIRTNAVPAFLATLKFKGGGGTSHVPVFDWLKEHREVPDLLVALTDLYSEYPDKKPPFPVLWCATETHGDPPPWGRVVVIPDTKD